MSVATSERLVHRFTCMGGVDVTIELVRPRDFAACEEAIQRAELLFRAVESSCTRFDPTSPLMQANAAGEEWCQVPPLCASAVQEAERAHRATEGRFDPRVLRDLTTLGYDKTLSFGNGPVSLGPADPAAAPRSRRYRPMWKPGFRPEDSSIRIGPVPIDLGGIGKGLAVRWAAERLHGVAEAFLIEAGGDLITSGSGPDGDGWRAAVEDPQAVAQEAAAPVAVLNVTDNACATSSIRLRSWTTGGRRVHHLIDPSTGEPGGDGLLSVTVVGPDPATCEVWSKTLFLAGPSGIADAAASRGLAALWVEDDGTRGHSPALNDLLLWEAPDAR